MSFDAYTTAGQGENKFQPLPILANRDPVNGVDFANPGGGPYQIDQKWFTLTNFNYWRYQGQGIWVKDSGGTGPLLQFTVPHGVTPIVPDGIGNVTLTDTDNTIVITGSSASPNNHTIDFRTNGSLVLQSLTGDDAIAVFPTAGNINLTGQTVLNGANTVSAVIHPVFFKKNASSVEELDVQVTTTSTSAAKSITNAGLASFNSTEFTVDSATGFVSLNNFSAFNYKQISFANSPYTVLPTDYYISCDPTGGPIAIVLPVNGAVFRQFIIKDRTGKASQSNITLTSAGGNIDAKATYTMAGNFDSINLLDNGTTYEVY